MFPCVCPVQTSRVSLQTTKAFVQTSRGAMQINTGSLQTSKSSLQMSRNVLQTSRALLQSCNAFLQTSKAFLQTNKGAMQINTSSLQTSKGSSQISRNVMQTCKAVLQTSRGSLQISKDSVQISKRPAHPENLAARSGKEMHAASQASRGHLSDRHGLLHFPRAFHQGSAKQKQPVKSGPSRVCSTAVCEFASARVPACATGWQRFCSVPRRGKYAGRLHGPTGVSSCSKPKTRVRVESRQCIFAATRR